MYSFLRICPAIVPSLALVLLFPYTLTYAELRKGQPESEEPQRPEIRLSRQGHIDVNANKRVLAWYVSDPSGLAYVEARIVKIEDRTLEQAELYRSEEPEGRVDLGTLKKGPGLYAILVKAANKEKEENEAGLRFSFAEVNPNCPTNKAWWPRPETVRGSGVRAAPETPYNPYQHNLFELSRRAGYVVMGRVGELIACPTEAGHLFTYVQFTGVKTLQKEGRADATDVPQEIFLRIPGGMAHGRVEIVSDAPVFRQGETVLLFLARDPRQQVPIVQGTYGVLLVDDDEHLRSYDGPLLTGVGEDFTVQLDPGFKRDPKWVRHWDPNMRAVWKSPPTTKPLGKPLGKEGRPAKPVALEEFLGHLEKAWVRADRIGRLPAKPDTSGRRPYGEMPRQGAAQGG